MSLYLGDNLISGVLTPIEPTRNIGQIIQSTIPLSDAGLHLLDGALISGSGAYADFVDYIASIYDASASYFCSESDWQTAVTNYGSCPCYVYNSTNNTVRLPKYTSEHGKLIKSNSSGSDWYRIYEDGWCEQGGTTAGSLSWGTTTVNLLKQYIDTNYSIALAGSTTASNDFTNSGNAGIRGTTRGLYLNTNKTTNNFVIQSNNDVSWYACGYTDISGYHYSPIYEYVVLATSTKTDIEVDIDEIATDLNGKADVDLSNIVASSSKNFDGQWVFSMSLLSTSTAVNTYEISLADYLPNDGYIYEVLLNGYINRTGNGNSALMLSSDIIDTQFTTFAICYSNNGNADGSAVTIPVGSTRKIKLRIDNQATSWTYLYALAYRRVGTNT